MKEREKESYHCARFATRSVEEGRGEEKRKRKEKKGKEKKGKLKKREQTIISLRPSFSIVFIYPHVDIGAKNHKKHTTNP